MTYIEWTALFPALALIVAAIGVVFADLWLKGRNPGALAVVSFAGVFGAGGMLVRHLRQGEEAVRAFSGAIVYDDMAAFGGLTVCVAAALLLVAAPTDTVRRRVNTGEYFALVLLSAASMCLLVASNDFITLFLNLETLSIAMYVLTGVTRRNPRSTEAAIKYLVTGAFSTGFLLMGITYLYGATGSVRLDIIGAQLGELASHGTGLLAAGPLASVGFALLLVGFAFKLGAAPFHMWVADAYEGAPTSTTAYMSVAVKAAAVTALIRVLLVAGEGIPQLWSHLLWGLALVTMLVGNLLALRQDSVKRMLAFSSIAHTGYALVALGTMQAPYGTVSSEGASAALFYVFVYTFMTLGAFLFLVYLGREVPVGNGKVEWQDAEHIDDLAGVAHRRPWAAVAMTIFLLSLAGMPPFAGFLGKFWLFTAAIAQGHFGLAIVGVIASLVSLYYYLRVVVWMFMKESSVADEKTDFSIGMVVAVAVIATVAFGLQPGALLEFATRSVAMLR